MASISQNKYIEPYHHPGVLALLSRYLLVKIPMENDLEKKKKEKLEREKKMEKLLYRSNKKR